MRFQPFRSEALEIYLKVIIPQLMLNISVPKLPLYGQHIEYIFLTICNKDMLSCYVTLTKDGDLILDFFSQGKR